MPRYATPIRLMIPILLLGASGASAQSAADFQALEKQVQALQAKVDKLQREQADSTVSYSGSAEAAKQAVAENKLQLSAGVTELKLYGDVRFRYNYDQFHPVVDVPATLTDDRNRFRLRLRIGADIQLGDQFFAGITLATNQASDTNNQTINEGYDNYGIYLDKVFGGWKPNDWFTLVLGKQANPFYTSNMVWDPSITPAGAVETLDLTNAFMPNTRFSLKLVSMQGVFENGSNFSTGSDTAGQFVEQFQGTYHFNKDSSLTFAPGFMTYTNASLSGLLNAEPFSKPNDVLAAAASVQVQTTTTTTNTTTVKYSSTGVPTETVTPVNTTTTTTTTTPATGAARAVTTTTRNQQQQVTVPTTLPTNPALANRAFVTTSTVGGGTVTVTTPVGASPADETKDLFILTAPGDVSFKLGGLATKLYWDFAYNTEGTQRATNEYFLSAHSAEDDYAWLVGLQLGQNERAGDLSLDVNFRRVGMDSSDPNINNNNFALSYMNVQGVQIGLAYNVTDSVVAAVTYYGAWRLNHNIIGGEATGGAQLANAKSVDVLQVDLNMKF
jgi:hypothetical protein